jgi:hypothetical protein
LTLQSPYRRNDTLERALEEVQSLQQSLIVARGTVAPRLLQIANEWHVLLRKERSRVGVRVQDTTEIPSPFVFGNPVTEREAEVFSGRRNIVQQIETCVFGTLQPPTILLHGPRRMGKTSILYQLPRLLGPEFSPAFVDCQNPAVTSSASTLLFYLSRSIGQGLQRRHVTVLSLPKEQMETESFARFDQWLDEVEHGLPLNMRILLCLDEYERLHRTVEAGWGEECLDALRHTLQHRSRIVVMFTGVHTFEQLGPAWTHRFISARRIRVSFLTREEILPLLTKPIPEFNMRYVPEALECIFAATNGQPFLTQAVAFELVQYLNEEKRKQANLADVENSIERALVTASEYFANVWYDAGTDGQAILAALAQKIKPPEARQARAWLKAQDVLTDDDRFAVPMMERWVRREKKDCLPL